MILFTWKGREMKPDFYVNNLTWILNMSSLNRKFKFMQLNENQVNTIPSFFSLTLQNTIKIFKYTEKLGSHII